MATTTTMNLIAKQTVGSGGASSITFSNIPQTFTDLKLVGSVRAATSGILVQFNGDTGANYSWRRLDGDGASAFSDSNTTYGSPYNTFVYWSFASINTNTANTFGNGDLYIPNYTNANYKSLSMDMVSENNATAAYQGLTAGLWSSTSAITSMTLKVDGGGNFAEFSTFYLYGISNSSTQNTTTPSAIGGDVITTDGTYWYHAFKYSGTFTPLKGLTADVLVIAGGGGASYGGGGGGAGGVFAATAQDLSSGTVYNCTVGGGGNYNSSAYSVGTNGSDSTFGSLTAAKGGGGGGSGVAGADGGSGGGGGEKNSAPAYAGGSSTQTSTGGTGYGNAGGSGGTYTWSGAGGGGAGAVGYSVPAMTNTGTSTRSGDGTSVFSSWGAATGTGENVSGTYYYAGGGGGASSFGTGSNTNPGGYGGGGHGATSQTNSATNGSANMGGGGGAVWNQTGVGKGGSGIVIVRYAV